jgi:hypothetical protein
MYKDVWTDLLGSCLLQREHLACNSGEGIVAVSFPSLPLSLCDFLWPRLGDRYGSRRRTDVNRSTA